MLHIENSFLKVNEFFFFKDRDNEKTIIIKLKTKYADLILFAVNQTDMTTLTVKQNELIIWTVKQTELILFTVKQTDGSMLKKTDIFLDCEAE